MVICILFPWKTVKIPLRFDQNKVDRLFAAPRLLSFIKKLLILMFFTEVSQIK